MKREKIPCIVWELRVKEIISFKIDKFRNQFHIFGASNIIAFLVFFGALIFFPRFLMRKIMCNPEMVYLVGVIIFGIGINIAISRCSKEEMKFLRTFFKNINIRKYDKYIKNRNLFIYQMLIVYFLMPYQFKMFKTNMTIVTLVEILTLCSVIINYESGKEKTEIFRTATIIGLALIMVIKNKTGINLYFEFPLWISLLICGISIFLMLYIITLDEKKYQKERVVKTVKVIDADYIFFFRKNKYLSLFCYNLISILLAFGSKEKGLDLSLEALFLCTYIWAAIFAGLIKYMDNTYIMFYRKQDIAGMIKEKILHSTIYAIPFVILNTAVFTFVSAKMITLVMPVIGYAIFMLVSFAFIPYFKKNYGKKLMKDKIEVSYLLIIGGFELIIALIV